MTGRPLARPGAITVTSTVRSRPDRVRSDNRGAGVRTPRLGATQPASGVTVTAIVSASSTASVPSASTTLMVPSDAVIHTGRRSVVMLAAEGCKAAFGINRSLTREDFVRRATGEHHLEHPPLEEAQPSDAPDSGAAPPDTAPDADGIEDSPPDAPHELVGIGS